MADITYQQPSRHAVLDEAMPAHGGDLHWASQTFGYAVDEWLDLSTGISPWSWLVPEVPAHIWRQLPQSDDGLREVAAGYYNCAATQLLTVPGTQYGIACIPELVEKGYVAIPAHGYQEHQQAWQKAGHRLCYYKNVDELLTLVTSKKVQYVVVINPNNPTGELLASATLNVIQESLYRDWGNGGLLLVDEAFMDMTPDESVVKPNMPNNIIVLRSIGKFFGLAGIRLGFVVSNEFWKQRLAALQSPWSINSPALFIGQQALADYQWIALQRQRLQHQSKVMEALLENALGLKVHNSGLFLTLWGTVEQCLEIFAYCARLAVLLRYGKPFHQDIDSSQQSQGAWIRFGLPGEQLDRVNVIFQKYTL